MFLSTAAVIPHIFSVRIAVTFLLARSVRLRSCIITPPVNFTAITALTGTLTTRLPSLDRPMGQGAGGAGFAESLGRLVSSVESTGADANQAVSQMLDGTGDVHDAMIALQRADMTLQLTVQVRNKLVNAYQEIMRMPI